MSQQKQIKLTIPTIDLVLLKKLKGGYSLYGGELDAAYCIEDGPEDNYPDADDGWEPDINTRDPREFEDYDFSQDTDGVISDFTISQEDDHRDSQHEEKQHSDGIFGPNAIIGSLSNDSIITDEIASQLLAGTGIDYVFNQSWLDEKSNGLALGATIYAGRPLPDGSIAEHDTIILSPNATVATINEELFHIWQGANCYNGNSFPTNHSTGPMELMVGVFGFIFDTLFGNGIYNDENDDRAMPSSLLYLLVQNVSLDGRGFDIDGFINNWDDSIFDDWKECYNGKGYGSGTLDDWEWNWKDAYNWWINTWNKEGIK